MHQRVKGKFDILQRTSNRNNYLDDVLFRETVAQQRSASVYHVSHEFSQIKSARAFIFFVTCPEVFTQVGLVNYIHQSRYIKWTCVCSMHHNISSKCMLIHATAACFKDVINK